MRQLKKFLIITLALLTIMGLSSCSLIKKYLPNTEEEEEKSAGYIETKENELFKYDVFNDHITIKGYLIKEKVVVVPDTIDEKAVTTIGSYAFYENNIPTNITLPNTITTIESNGFYCCYDLTEIAIPESVTFIGERAFAKCTDLAKITLPAGLIEISDYAFNDCASMESITIPSNATKIGMRAFSYCSSLIKIELPLSVTSVKENAFFGCTALKFAIIPSEVTEIGAGVFKNCTLLTVVTPEGTICAQYCNDNEINKTVVRPADYDNSDESGNTNSNVSDETSK